MNFYDIFAVVAAIVLAAVFFYFFYRLNKLLNELSPKEHKGK